MTYIYAPIVEVPITSTWVGPFNFCTNFAAPFYNGFESEATNNIPACWNSKINSFNPWIEVQQQIGLNAPYAGIKALYINNSNATNLGTDTVMVITPRLFDLTAGDKQIRFHANSDDQQILLIVGTMASPDDTVLNPLDTIHFPQIYDYREVIVPIDAANGYNGTDEYVYLAHNLNRAYNNIRIDNFHYEPIRNCKKPTDLSIDNLSHDSVDISWTENNSATQWEVQYDSAGFVPGSGISVNANSNPATLHNLTSNTMYEYYVRSICGGGDSSYWSGPTFFETSCTLSTAPYFNNFETDPLYDAPFCWRSEITGIYSTFSTVEVGAYTGLNAPFSGSRALYFFGYYNSIPGIDKVMAITPGFSDLTAGDKQIRFFANSDDTVNQLIIGTMAHPNDNNLNPLDTITFATGDTYQEVIFEFTTANGYNGTDQYIYLAHSLGSNYNNEYIRIDDFHYEIIPICNKPDYYSLAIDSLTPTSVNFSWIEPSISTTWQVEYGPVGFIPGTGTASVVTSNPANISGLTPNTAYQIYIQSICGRGDTSYAAGPLEFKTPCSLMAPYYNDFETDPLNEKPLCWIEQKTAENPYIWIRDLTGIHEPYSGSRAMYINSSNATNSDKLLAVSPNFPDLVAGDKQIRFFANVSTTAAKLIIGTMSNSMDINNLNAIDTISFAQANVYKEVIFEITSANGYNGTDQYIYLAHDLGSTNSFIRIDEFHYETIPSCKKPGNSFASNISSSTADLSWTEKNAATEWQIEYGISGFAFGSGIDSLTNNNPLTLTGLDSASYYEFYVRSVCAIGDSSIWNGPFKFVTDCPASYPAPYFNDFEDERLDGTNLLGFHCHLCWKFL